MIPHLDRWVFGAQNDTDAEVDDSVAQSVLRKQTPLGGHTVLRAPTKSVRRRYEYIFKTSLQVHLLNQYTHDNEVRDVRDHAPSKVGIDREDQRLDQEPSIERHSVEVDSF